MVPIAEVNAVNAIGRHASKVPAIARTLSHGVSFFSLSIESTSLQQAWINRSIALQTSGPLLLSNII